MVTFLAQRERTGLIASARAHQSTNRCSVQDDKRNYMLEIHSFHALPVFSFML